MTAITTPEPQGVTPTPEITISEFGAQKALGILEQSGKDNAGVRVFIKSGGCSGYQYGMAIDDRELDGDLIVHHRGVKLLVDPMSLPLLRGSEVDFVENMMGGGFTVHNPNATSNCGCGHSFRTDGAQSPDGEGSGGCGSA
ncbi:MULTISPECIES: HesB/IscA family protein [Deinococcus]|uniref:Iron-sulfur cluster assembly accessory protein n=2 Tax=Deinococcus TaxID=1298 RepID=A0A221SY51_9DEIO|nr:MULTISPECIES: iron-sulfur cluster assembly accessory protein [Deinococcus]ASN81526.1 iron-sulfur cluster assembly accessory protein [Deinococcus ficus]MDP9765094.1 iron-sulfur cluster assembly accessory protein [Deinococcus enclensis]